MTSYLPGWEYDVFLSFNDQDTSRKFADHLLTAMDKKGIVAYNSRSEDVGERVQLPTSVEAIRGSRFSVIVFSVNYASSLTCLDEILKIVETRKTVGCTILPVFYDVDPSVVRKQSHSFKNPFDEYLVRFENESDKVEKWRAALSEVASISGWHLHDKSENQCIQEIVEVILSKLNDSFANVADELVGIDSRVDELMSYLELQSRDVRKIAICGVPGIGKTTIARCVCDKIFGDFQGTCFLTNVSQASRKNGIEKLQAQIVSEIFNEDTQQLYDARSVAMRLKNKLQRQCVLLILDGVDDLEQLEMLAGDQDWFGPGSRIIITATDEDLFRNYDVDDIYKPGELREDEAFRLLSLKAFNQAYPPEEYVELSKQIVTNAKCIPAAIDALGTFLYGRSSNEWESTVRRLQENAKL